MDAWVLGLPKLVDFIGEDIRGVDFEAPIDNFTTSSGD